MENMMLYIAAAIVVAAAIGFGIYWIAKFCKMSPEQKKQLIVTYLVGVVTKMEDQLGSGRGDEKLKKAEEYFQKNAGAFYKTLLTFFGKDKLKDLIEEALKMVKKNFGGDTK